MTNEIRIFKALPCLVRRYNVYRYDGSPDLKIIRVCPGLHQAPPKTETIKRIIPISEITGDTGRFATDDQTSEKDLKETRPSSGHPRTGRHGW